jgi:hypothetical protein
VRDMIAAEGETTKSGSVEVMRARVGLAVRGLLKGRLFMTGRRDGCRG